MTKINKLKLTWIGKEDEPLTFEPRLLFATPEYSYGEVEPYTLTNGKPWSSYVLIHQDNLLALRALEQDFAGQIKCIYIDLPYNTVIAFEHYDDNVEHSIWLSLMRERLVILQKLLSEERSIWITIKKIHKVPLDPCEFDHDDYSLNIVSVPDIEDDKWKENESEDEVKFNA